MTNADVIYRCDTYVPLVGSPFAVHRDGGDAVGLELEGATRLPSDGECFSLVFRGGSGAGLDQRIYRLEHASLGEFPLFLVPIAPAEDGEPRFEAVVNRPGAVG
ncbi:MAG TPA: hypothetical protein VMB53_13845 [Gaiellaceae bacterium]|nr:hypothetical protein [Gaiellaceae bacterium]